MPEWLVERGIGETRAALVDQGEIIEGRIEPDGTLPSGSVIRARLVNLGVEGRNAIAVAEGGAEYMLPKGGSGSPQGTTVKIEVTRETIPGTEAWKFPLARVTTKPVQEMPPLSERLRGRALTSPAPRDELASVGWDDLIDQARTGEIMFAGGVLRISATPAMTLIDVDGYLAPDELAILGAAEAALTIRRLDIGGSIGIDLPTVGSKTARQRAATGIDDVLPQPFERTAVNGFGFVQIVRPRSRASLIELAQDRPSFEARALLRRATFDGAGARRLVAHPSIIAVLERRQQWLNALAGQLGGSVSLRADAHLPMSGGYVEAA